MNNLPTEVFQDILQLLPTKTVYQCTLVCHQWSPTAEKRLYNRVLIYNQEKLDKFWNTMKQSTSKRNQVFDFKLLSALRVGFDKRLVLTMFPNLRHISFQQWSFRDLPRSDCYGQFNSDAPLNSTLSSVGESNNLEFTLCLIQSDLCARLERLHITLMSRSQQPRHLNPIHQLKNMPVLKKIRLDIRNHTLKIEDIENLHQNIPSITDFYLHGAVLDPSETVPDTKPNSSTKSIDWEFGNKYNPQTAEGYIQCFHYIKNKYSDLVDLSISYGDSQLSSLDSKHIFERGWSPLLQSIGAQLKRIACLEAPPSMNIFDILDGYGCKVKDLKVSSGGYNFCIHQLDDFIRSNQRQSIRKLYLEYVQPLPAISLKDTKLEILSLNYGCKDRPRSHPSTPPVVLNKLLRICPDTLDKLELKDTVVKYDEDDDGFRSSITCLEVNKGGYGCVKRDLEESIRKICPKLKHVCILDI